MAQSPPRTWPTAAGSGNKTANEQRKQHQVAVGEPSVCLCMSVSVSVKFLHGLGCKATASCTCGVHLAIDFLPNYITFLLSFPKSQQQCKVFICFYLILILNTIDFERTFTQFGKLNLFKCSKLTCSHFLSIGCLPVVLFAAAFRYMFCLF